MRKALLAAGLLLTFIGLLAGVGRTSSIPHVMDRIGPSDRQQSLKDLPLAAHVAISASIGSDDAAYQVATVMDELSLTNARHDFSARFTDAGVRIAANALEDVWLAFRGYGYANAIDAAVIAAPTAAGSNRIEYPRGDLVEWYINGPLGLEQGFTIAAPPLSGSGPLTIALSLRGQSGELEHDRRGLALGAGLRYGGLVAFDANGRELPAWMELRDEQLDLRVEDAGAVYPIVIDPLVQLAKLTGSDSANNDRFGISVAISGDTVVVGTAMDDPGNGAAYVFSKPGGGWANMSQTAKLTASDSAAGDRFGSAVAISGDTIVVGAFFANAPLSNQGAAYVFLKPGGGWATTSAFAAKLTASDGAANEAFGAQVAISGDTIVVGVQFANAPNSHQGAVYVFVKPGGGWATTSAFTAKLTASDGATNDEFGVGLEISGDTIVVGAKAADISGKLDQGAAYIFVKPGAGWATTSTFTAKLTASDGVAGDEFGISVGISGITVVVGAWLDDPDNVAPFLFPGAAYVFVRPGGGWATTSAFTAKLKASDAANADDFGFDVAIDGDTVVVGAREDDTATLDSPGSAYVFVKPAGGWATMTQTAKVTPSDGANFDQMGYSVAVSGGTVVAGAPGFIFGNTHPGSAYVFGSLDSDGDGYEDALEQSLGENPNLYCPIMRANVDMSPDNTVSILDLAAVAQQFGQNIPPATARYNQLQNSDTSLNILDLAAMAAEFGKNVSLCP